MKKLFALVPALLVAGLMAAPVSAKTIIIKHSHHHHHFFHHHH